MVAAADGKAVAAAAVGKVVAVAAAGMAVAAAAQEVAAGLLPKRLPHLHHHLRYHSDQSEQRE